MTTTRNVLELSEVSLTTERSGGGCIRDISFGLQEGELAMVLIEPGVRFTLLSDVVQGLAPPAAGSVLFRGRGWNDISRAQTNRSRHRIGRVFHEHAWINNLTVKENILLAPDHHHHRSAGELAIRAYRFCRYFGLSGLPDRRPSEIALHELQLAQWVRALLGRKRLLILENPTRYVSAIHLNRLLNVLHARRRHGSAVLWITQNETVFYTGKIRPSARYCIEDDRFILQEQHAA